MSDTEETVVQKLRGNNIVIKFKDGDTLYYRVDFDDEEDELEWFSDAERFINKKEGIFPISCIAIAADSIKYIRKI